MPRGRSEPRLSRSGPAERVWVSKLAPSRSPGVPHHRARHTPRQVMRRLVEDGEAFARRRRATARGGGDPPHPVAQNDQAGALDERAPQLVDRLERPDRGAPSRPRRRSAMPRPRWRRWRASALATRWAATSSSAPASRASFSARASCWRLDACAPRRERARSPVRRAGGPRRCRPARDDAERACASSRRRSASAPSASSISLPASAGQSPPPPLVRVDGRPQPFAGQSRGCPAG